MMRFRIAVGLILGAAAIASTGPSGVLSLGQTAACATTSALQSLQSLSGYEILFGTVLTKMDPQVRRSALLALGEPKCLRAGNPRRTSAGSGSPRGLRPASLGAPSRPRARSLA